MEPHHDDTRGGSGIVPEPLLSTIYPTATSDNCLPPSKLLKRPHQQRCDISTESKEVLLTRQEAMHRLAASDKTNHLDTPYIYSSHSTTSNSPFWTPSPHGLSTPSLSTVASSPGSVSTSATSTGSVFMPSTDLALADCLPQEVDSDHSLEYEIQRDMGMVWRERPLHDASLTWTGVDIPFHPPCPEPSNVAPPPAHVPGHLDPWVSSDNVSPSPAHETSFRRPSTVDELQHWGNQLRAQAREHLDMIVEGGQYDVSPHDIHHQHCWGGQRWN